MSQEWTQEQLTENLRTTCGIKPGDILIIHSSAAAVGNVAGGVYTMLRAIQAAVTAEGTILMPVFTNPQPDGVFKMKRTPSRVGLLTEAMRRSPSVVRSKHPTHSMAAWGKRAAELTSGHELTTGVGKDSPLHKAADAGADVLHIGCDMRTSTLVHLGEALFRVPYLGKVSYPGYDTTLTFVDLDGSQRQVKLTDNPGDGNGFLSAQNELERRKQILRGKFGDADCMKFSGANCLQVVHDLLSKDLTAVLCDNARCAVCPKSREIIKEYLKQQGK